MVIEFTTWQQKAEEYIIQQNYIEAAIVYEKTIEIEPKVLSHYCHLGLLLLLQGLEAEAQMTWMLPITDIEEDELQNYTNELTEILQVEVERREKVEDYQISWLICQHIREINPKNFYNLLKIVRFSIKLEKFDAIELIELGIIPSLKEQVEISDSINLLVEVLSEVLEYDPLNDLSLEFVEACLPYFPCLKDCLSLFLTFAMKVAYIIKQPQKAICFLNLYMRLDPNNLECLRQIASFYQDSRNYTQGIETAKLCYLLSQNLPDKIFAIHLVLRGLMGAGGYWEETCTACEQLESLLAQLVEAQPLPIDEVRTLRLLTPSFAIPHLKDNPIKFRKIHNQVAIIVQNNIRSIFSEQFELYSQHKQKFLGRINTTKPLRIGYLASTFKKHSVGWLARWLFQHHDKKKFETHAYFINYESTCDSLQEWYVNSACHAHKLGINEIEIANKIYKDEIDILVDLDSITLDITSQIMLLKPAPVQVTWLGWDASGIPAIDYYIADPYVLPDDAQDYYTEKICRLPNTYIAVDGFEVGIPTLRREDLDIPSDAIIYLSAQRGYKRNPETTKWQMKIIKEVKNSYFLIKGLSEEDSIKNFFYTIAEEEGVDCSKLRFLPQDASELTHRANLAIADIVLDTYPYNGATTTLETLWMGIPLVTRVGEQFAARNSYTMMVNAGINEGIAWTDEEYIEWGIRLGKDEILRQKVAWKLRQSRHSAPLWNAKQFTRDMEKAYQQMWQRYVEGS